MELEKHLTYNFNVEVVFAPKRYEKYILYDIYVGHKCVRTSATKKEVEQLKTILKLKKNDRRTFCAFHF